MKESHYLSRGGGDSPPYNRPHLTILSVTTSLYRCAEIFIRHRPFLGQHHDPSIYLTGSSEDDDTARVEARYKLTDLGIDCIPQSALPVNSFRCTVVIHPQDRCRIHHRL